VNENVDSEMIVYLNAKERIDLRARNPQIWARLLRELKACHSESGQRKLKVTELGGGLGGLACALLDACDEIPLDYTLVELDARVAATAQARLEGQSYSQHTVSVVNDDLLNPGLPDQIGQADLVVAQSMLDLLDLRVALPHIVELAKPGALFYAPVTFNGFTEFRPPYADSQVEYQLLTTYHRSMDEHTGIHPDAGGSRAGWVLQRNIRRQGGAVLETGSSDWLVTSDPAEPTHRDFLTHILNFFEHSLSNRTDFPQYQLNLWLDQRRQEMDNGHLMLHIHNLDLLAEFPS
jgi:Methyltransferase domain